MAEGNGEISIEEVPGKDSDAGRTPDYIKLIDYGLDPKVATKLDDIYKTGKLAHEELDERALDALKEFPSDGALSVLGQFLDSNLEHVSNKSAFLCGVMKTYRQKSRAGVQGAPALAAAVQVKGPDEEKIRQILQRTGYTLDVTTGQRKYGGPPPGWEGGTPGAGCEVFCGKIPKDMYEDELIPLFESCGTIWDLRLMMDPMSGANRGYAFVTFTTREATQRAVQELDNHEIKPGKTLRIKISVPNLRLFVGNIPKSKGKEEILEEFGKLTAGLVEVIIYSSPDDKKKNRGFCFLEYESHKAASLAKRRLGTGRIKVWGCDIIVDWADPQEEPDEQTMSKVKVLYVRNLTQEITEEALKEEFERYGNVERVKKIKDYAFVHFEDRDCAVKAMQEIDGKELGGARLEVSLAKPPSDKKKKEEILRARERRMTQMIYGRGGFDWCSCSPVHGALRGRTPQPQPRPPQARGDYDYDYDYYGYGDYRGGYNEPFYRYDEFYFDYAGPPQPSAVRQPPNRAQPVENMLRRLTDPLGKCLTQDDELALGPDSLYYDLTGGIQGAGSCGTGARWGRRGAAAGARGGARRAARGRRTPSGMRGNPRAKPSLPGKRKLDGGQQIAGGERESKRRLGAAAAAARGWGSAGVGSMGSMGSEGAAAS
ncbi:heterogeneous nuclear ribonucleoprotein R isoform X1 [Danaus plexippus]|uniref:heterogeneous nuclear ribonucleoprotein R isoform X1 n=1 Tax=Danaus plexippus TaxID=13037 RepID=UPI0013C5355D|nr:heterogeneous nuclear ribonucleoprotein R isoform X1 [Danaus plexippus]XP_032515963.1 heterogeneous nuclear ribonucleoprotein R isoform X1 [Danaus plexippus]XP_032515964.1 heterogeneous nuclear ribonucleoprotein R isoform X1 [Danaus plexippus]